MRFIEAGGYEDETYWKAGGFGKFKSPEKWQEQLKHPTRPVVGVTWYEAKAYANWTGCRLPIEAEWERVARGHSEDYRKFAWGNKEPDKETLNSDKIIGHPSPVGIFPESCTPEGVIDMAGNVWEWCEDWYGEYPSNSVTNPFGPEGGSSRILRGGSFLFSPRYCRSAYRYSISPANRDIDIGFRLVLRRS